MRAWGLAPRVCLALVLGAWLSAVGPTQGQSADVKLPPPRMEGGKPLLQALKERRTVRDFKLDPLPPQALSDLLWAAFGMNRPEISHRTAPSAMNSQEIDIYVATASGLYLYDAKAHALTVLGSDDVRAGTGGQPFAKDAPVTLVFVADLPRLAKARPEDREFYAGIDTGYISQNVYLFCASEGLGTVVHDLDRAPLARLLKLRADQKIILAQAVGYPKP